MNVGSQETAIGIYHSGQYMTHLENIMFSFGSLMINKETYYIKDTLVNASTISFGHNWSLVDTIDITVSLVNDSAILTNGHSINCLFEDQIYWKIDTFPSGTTYGTWTFVHNNTGIDLNTTSGIANSVFRE